MDVFRLQCWVCCHNGPDNFDRVQCNVFVDDTVKHAKEKIATLLSVRAQNLRLFFHFTSVENLRPSEVDNVLAIAPGFGIQRLFEEEPESLPISQADIIEFDRENMIGALRDATPFLIVVVHNAIPKSVSLYPESHSLSPPIVGSIVQSPIRGCTELLRLKSAVVQFEGWHVLVPEYLFQNVKLSASVPFAMCRSLIPGKPCPIKVFAEGTLSRSWPFRTLKCQHSLRPHGVIFRVALDQEFVQVEILATGSARVTINQIPPECDKLQEVLIVQARSALAVLIAHIDGLSNENLSIKIAETSFEYFVFTAVTDIRSLIDDQALQERFVEIHPTSTSKTTDLEDENDEEFDTTKKSTSGSVSKRVVNLMFCPPNVRTKQQQNRHVRCRLLRSASNGIYAVINSSDRHSSAFVLLAACELRATILRTLPRDLEKSHSTLKIVHVDPELYYSIKNCGYSRKTWSSTETSTGWTRYRQAVPINPENQQDMARYQACRETGPRLKFRGIEYAALQDEENNRDKVLAARDKLSKGAKQPKELFFYNLVILKEITERKYRATGSDGEEFRYIPACIRYRGEGKLPQRPLAILATLYRRNEIDIIGKGADDIIKQISAFGKIKTNQTYVLKANKTLSVGTMGVVPSGPLSDYFTKILQVEQSFRCGVYRDRNQRYASYHAFLSAIGDAKYLKCINAEMEQYVRAQWPKIDKDHRPISVVNDEICQELSCSKHLNIICFHQSTVDADMQVCFVNDTFDPNRDTILFLRTLNGVLFEPLSLDGATLIKAGKYPVLDKLFEATCPQVYQHRQRMLRVERLLGDGWSLSYQVGFDKQRVHTIVFAGPSHGENLCLPVVVHNASGEITFVPGEIPRHFDLSWLYQKLCLIGEAYEPKMLVRGHDGSCAMVLADTRLVCLVKAGADLTPIEHLQVVSNNNLVNPLMLIAASNKPPSCINIPQTREHFFAALKQVQSLIEQNQHIRKLDCLQRREQLHALVDPIVPQSETLSRQVFALLLVSYCEAFPDTNSWFQENTNPTNDCDLTDTNSIIVESPNAYVEWVARLE